MSLQLSNCFVTVMSIKYSEGKPIAEYTIKLHSYSVNLVGNFD